MRDAIAPFAGSIRDDAPVIESADLGVIIDVPLAPAMLWTEPTSITAMVGEIAIAGLTIGELWACSETSSATAIAGLAGKDLTPLATVATAIPGQRAYGLFNGANFKSLRAIEVADPAALFRAPLTTDFEPAAADFGILIAFRVAQRTSAQASIVGKATAAHAAGFALYLETDGTLTWRVVGTGGDRTVVLAGNHGDGAWHFVAAYRSGGTIGVFSDLTAEATTVAATTDVTSAGAYFAIGATAGASAAWQQTKLAAYLTGAQIAGQRTAMLSWWTARVTRTPTSFPSANYVRTSSLMSAVDVDAENGLALSIAAVGAPAPMYMPYGSDTYGIQFAPAFTSIVQYSNPSDAAGWTSIDAATVTAQAADDPRGVRHAVAIGKTAASPTGRRSIGVALTSGSVYHFAIAIRWDGTGPSAPRLRLRNPTDTTTHAEIVVTTAGRWHYIVTPAYTAASTATYLLQILASSTSHDTAGGVLVQYASGGVGSQFQPLPSLARGATVANTITTLYLSGEAGRFGRASNGRLEAIAASIVSPIATMPAARNIATLLNSGTSMTRQVYIDAGRPIYGATHNDAGTLTGPVSIDYADDAVAHKFAVAWKNYAYPGITISGFLDEASDAQGFEAFALPMSGTVTDPDTLVIGGRTVGTLPHLGGISRVRVRALPWVIEPPSAF